jgi:hypothetical protein
VAFVFLPGTAVIRESGLVTILAFKCSYVGIRISDAYDRSWPILLVQSAPLGREMNGDNAFRQRHAGVIAL